MSVCLNDMLKSFKTKNKTKEKVTITNTSLLVHYKKETDHQAEAHVTCHLKCYMIGELCKLNEDDFESNIIMNTLIHLL